jgi:FkbM family methyltransferase
MALPAFKGRDRLFLAVRRHLRAPDGLLFLRCPDGSRWEVDLGEEIDAALYVYGSYEPESLAIIRALLAPGTDAVDIGANIGALTVGMAGAAAPGRVLAFEPSEATFNRLSRNLELNGCSNVKAYSIALGDRTGWGQLAPPIAHRAGDDKLNPAPAEGSARFVQLDTLDAVCAREHLTPALLKLDVEGAEWSVLRGAERVLASGPRLLLEANSAASAGSHHPFEMLYWLSERFGYKFRLISGTGLELCDLRSREEVNRNVLGALDDRAFAEAVQALSGLNHRMRFEVWPTAHSGPDGRRMCSP